MKKRVVLIGGGHGLSNIVRDFKNENIDLSIVVSSTDDGGHTGKIREEFNFVAIGDLRMVLNELISDGSSIKDIFDYRFESIHGVNGVSLGNLIITSLLNIYGNIDDVIDYFKRKENVDCNIFLSSNNPLTLCAKCVDGEIIKKEHVIGESNKNIDSLYVEKEEICNPIMLSCIENADIIVLAPGSLYTSVGAVLCIDSIKKAIAKSKAEIVYICNIMSQDGETLGYTVNDHEEALSKIMNKNIDRVIANNGCVGKFILNRYKEENSYLVGCSNPKDYYEFYDLIQIKNNKIRHNSELTKKIILRQ